MLYETFYKTWSDGKLEIEIEELQTEWMEYDLDENDYIDITPLEIIGRFLLHLFKRTIYD